MSAPPSAVARLRRSLLGAAPAVALVLVFGFVVDAVASPGDRQTAINLLVSIVAVLGLQVYIGNTGVLTFGHLAFMAAGAYGSALVTIPVAVRASQVPDLPLLGDVLMGDVAATLFAGLAAAAVAAVLGVLFARFSGTAAVIATFGLLAISNTLLNGLDGVTGGAQGLYGVPRTTTVAGAAVVAAIAIVVARLVRGSRLGLRLAAARHDELAAAAAGIDVVRVRWAAWVVSAALLGVAGAVQAHTLAIVSPTSFYLTPTFTLLSMLIVGGMRTVSGAIAGAVAITAATEVLRGIEDGFTLGSLEVGQAFGVTQIAIGLLVLLMLVRRPNGLLGTRELDERRAAG
jgi:branched-chain amino acid transport system permease protein